MIMRVVRGWAVLLVGVVVVPGRRWRRCCGRPAVTRGGPPWSRSGNQVGIPAALEEVGLVADREGDDGGQVADARGAELRAEGVEGGLNASTM